MTTTSAGDTRSATTAEPTTDSNTVRTATKATAHSPEHEHASLTPRPASNLTLPRLPLIGRDPDLAALQQLLLQEQVGLLTLTGSGGIGKTRLALQVAANLLDHFVDGVYFVSLAPISAPELVSTMIAQALGVQESGGLPLQESLHNYLRDKQLLLVLDNFEQVVTAAPVVGELLKTCARLKVLVTSRATLHLYGEQEFPVPPLALPDPKQLAQTDPNASLAHYAAIELFCQRALAAKPDFALTPNNAATVADICIKLDGLPLAIELAAARIKLFSPAALLARLNQRLTLLTNGPHDLPTRQRTLRDEIAWSYDLLTIDEQTLFRRLAVFVGGFTLEAAQAVGDPSAGSGQVLSGDVLDGVATLVDQNLLKQVEKGDGEARFGMLETIREYGLEQLVANGEAETVRRRHADFFLWLAERAEPTLLGRQRKQGLAQLEADLDNFRAALLWSQADANRAETGLRLAGALSWFAHFSNHANEVRGWLATTLQSASQPTWVRAKALWGAGLMALILGEYQQAKTEFEESVTLWRALGDQRGLAVALRELCAILHFLDQPIAAQQCGEESVAFWRMVDSPWDLAMALDNLAFAIAAQGNKGQAHILFEEELALFEAIGDSWGQATALNGLGCIAGQQGNYAAARVYLMKALALRRVEAEKFTLAEALTLLGEVLQHQGEWETASKLYGECLIVAHDNGSRAVIAHVLHQLGTLAQAQNQIQRAVRLFASAAALRASAGGLGSHTTKIPAEQIQAIATARATLDEEAFAVLWTEGQAMKLDQTIAFALSQPAPAEAAPLVEDEKATPLLSPAGLTAREVEVLRLLVQGLTYAQIADTLIISRRTVNSHASTIYSKLGVTSRAAAMRLALDHRLV